MIYLKVLQTKYDYHWIIYINQLNQKHMGIWNEIQEQLVELQRLLDERKELDNLYNQIKKENDRITDFS